MIPCGIKTSVTAGGERSEQLKANVSSVSPSPKQMKELWVVLGLYAERWSYAIGRNVTWQVKKQTNKNNNKLVE